MIRTIYSAIMDSCPHGCWIRFFCKGGVVQGGYLLHDVNQEYPDVVVFKIQKQGMYDDTGCGPIGYVPLDSVVSWDVSNHRDRMPADKLPMKG